ncbi:MAG: 2OG-Fe(II) oxygenase [Alphaproteobacteria bacterium]|jgi:uncharacterized protein|nr:2OG-Fe(II) oxygenase [Alphaproteobacteria bacterium]MBT4085919.1 2OG-Fe(II) oxygenase [Alphaproteobacteria bacterium]MBT4542608.1 2OG-Fe(II) oxygenase [Alphaproteobacteria bacterium]MBT7746812.1 2OG-Fe(II) oxygenase [Alphaproteobacteria bacterium]
MTLKAPIEKLDWPALTEELVTSGFASAGKLLDTQQCTDLIEGYDSGTYRSHIHMARYNFGRGEYKYFARPLPDLVQNLRRNLYEKLVPAANLWAQRLNMPRQNYPDSHEAWLQQCHDAGQTRPTPLVLRYEAGDYNCLHQDLYGDIWFPFQVVFMLNTPGKDFTGGEFVLTETRPRMQSIANVIPLQLGEAAIFAVNYCPGKSVRGYSRTSLRHGVSKVRSGHRHTMGLIFHDAK